MFYPAAEAAYLLRLAVRWAAGLAVVAALALAVWLL